MKNQINLEKVKRVEKVLLAMSLSLAPLLDELTKRRLVSMLSSDEWSRFEKALTGDYKAYPAGTGLFVVHSYGETESDDSKYQLIYPRSGEPLCNCKDYYFRQQNKSPGTGKCKHQWRVWIEQNVGLLPNTFEDPFIWLTNQTESKLFDRIEDDSEPTTEQVKEISQLKSIYNYMSERNPPDVDLQKAYSAWASFHDVEASR